VATHPQEFFSLCMWFFLGGKHTGESKLLT
jgi:hypothetical protein